MSSSSLRESVLNLHPNFAKLIQILESAESNNPHRKSASRAINLRDQGNASYKLQEYGDAIKFYTQSIATAPNGSQQLALAYGNRSGVSWINRNYECCLLDTNRALTTNGPLPEKSVKELNDRRTKAFLKLEALDFRKEKLAARYKNLHILERSAKLTLLITPSPLEYDDVDIPDPSRFDFDAIWRTNLTNQLVPGLSSKVKIHYNAEYGRHFIATEDIEPGEVIFIDDYFCMMTTKNIEKRQCYCSFCAAWCEALIPCTTCTQEMYCSKRCRQMANELYHRTECKLLPFLTEAAEDGGRLGMFLPLRLFLAGTRHGDELPRMMKDQMILEILAKEVDLIDAVYAPNSYLAALNLLWKDSIPYSGDSGDATDSLGSMMDQVTKLNLHLPENSPQLNFVEEVFMQLFAGLRQIGFFRPQEAAPYEERLNDVELFGGLLLFQNLKLVDRNHGVPVRTTFDNPHQWQVCAWAFGGLTCLLNHSCDPNTGMIMNRRQGLTYSVRPIQKGEQIFTQYQADYCQRPKDFRQEHLKKIFSFECKCRACVEDWPLQEALAEQEIAYLPETRNAKKGEVKKMTTNFIKLISSTAYEIDREANLKKALQFSKTVRRWVTEPSAAVISCEEYINLMMRKKGNYYIKMQDAVVQDGYGYE